jgi:iron complex outermembrane receptor protein
MRPHLILALGLGAASVASAQATQTKPDSARSLPGVTVTATREPAPILRTPLAITKIDAPELRATNGYGLEDALTLVPGVVAQSRYGTSDIRLMIRGFGARGAGDRSNSGTTRGVRILLDGFPETEPDGRTAFDHIDLAAAEAVEVVRSNASSIYGNAAGGVVNVLTAPATNERSFELQPIFGGFGLKRYATRMSAPVGAGVGYATFTNTTFDGWRQHSDARRFMLNAGVVAPVGDKTKLGVYLAAANNLMHVPGPLTQAQVDADPTQAHASYLAQDERRYNRLGRLGFTLDQEIDPTTSWSTMFYVNPKYLQRSERNTFRDFTRIHFGGNVIGRKNLVLGDLLNKLSVGLDEAYQDGAIQFYNLAADSTGTCPGAGCTVTTLGTRGPTLTDNKGEGANNFGVFVQDDIRVSDKLSLLVGARYDNIAYHNRSFVTSAATNFRGRNETKHFDRVSPKLGFAWALDAAHSFYGNIGGGVEVPAGNETDAVAPTGTTAPTALTNPLLDAINSTTYELGFKSLATSLGPIKLGYDVAVYDAEVQNEIIPYRGGRYYASVARARRMGVELGANAMTTAGIFGGGALTLSRNKYLDYVVDSALIANGATGKVDRSDNDQVGIPSVIANAEVGMEVPRYRALRVKLGVEHSGEYFADDANTVTVPAFTILNATLELRKPIAAANNWGLRGFVTVHNIADTKYIGSAFLNPAPAPGAGAQPPAAFEPGMPRSVILSFSVGKLR